MKLYVPLDLLGLVESKAFASLWKSLAPSKIIAFAWQLLLDKIPSRNNLLRRHILLPANDRCVWCGSESETVMHIFIYCDTVRNIWTEVFSWLRLDFSLPHNLFFILNFMMGLTGKKYKKLGLIMIWMAVVWAMWKMRNSVIFNNGVVQVKKAVDDIKLWSWKWWLGRVKPSAICLFYEWIAEPLICLDKG
jgi:hypothetical protein